MTTNRYALLLLMILGLAPLTGVSEELGDPAPELQIKEWIKGGPVEIKPGTNIYVVVIWGTRNPTIAKTITKLNELQDKYKDNGVIVLGISDETPDRVRNYVERPGVNINYTIGADTASRTAKAYMRGLKLRSIPRAFIVGKDGKLLWQGDPVSGLDFMLAEVVADKFDLARAKETDLFRVQIETYRTMAHKGDPRAHASGEMLIAGWTNNVRHLSDFAYYIINDPKNPRRDFALAGHALDLAEKAAQTNSLRLLTTRAAYLMETGKPEQAIAMTKEAIAAAKDPKETTLLEAYLKRMEARAKSKSPKAQNSGTNAVDSASATNATSTVITPPSSTNAVKAPAPSSQ